jgi:hypothetical protein
MIYCAEYSAGLIRQFDLQGTLINTISIASPIGLTFDSNGILYCSSLSLDTVSKIYNETTTVISVDSSYNKIYGEMPFSLGATSNSRASFSYFSSDISVATVDSSGVVTLVDNGTTTIITSQPAFNEYTPASATTTITVDSSTFNNPTPVYSTDQLEYFLTSDASYASIKNDLTKNFINNTRNTSKTILNNTSEPVEITTNFL